MKRNSAEACQEVQSPMAKNTPMSGYTGSNGWSDKLFCLGEYREQPQLLFSQGFYHHLHAASDLLPTEKHMSVQSTFIRAITLIACCLRDLSKTVTC